MARHDAALRQEAAQGGGRRRLARMRPQGVQAGVERPHAAQQSLHRQGARQVGRLGQAPGPVQGEHPESEHPLGAVEQAQPFLGAQGERGEVVSGQHLRRRAGLPRDAQQALADERPGQVGEGGQVTRRAHRPLPGDHRQQVEAQKVEEPLDDLDPHPRIALGQGPGAQQEHRPHQRVGQRRAHPGGVAAQQGHLGLVRLGRVDASVGQRPEAGGDPVDHPAVPHRLLHQAPGRGHAGRHPGAEAHRRPPLGDGHHVLGPQGVAGEHHFVRHRLPPGRPRPTRRRGRPWPG